MSSRESDNAHPTPRRTGPDAYPSGTPPYGTPGLPGGDRAGTSAAQGPASGGEDEAPKTETTLTTRVRINIPGSRPIPPVVVRSAVKNEDGPGDDTPPAATEPPGPRHRSAAPSSPVLGVMDGGARTATPPNLPPEWQIPPATSEAESTGAWFRPRQKKASSTEPAPAPAGTPAEPAGGAGARPNGARKNGSQPGGARQTQASGQGTDHPNGRPVPGQAPAPAPRPTGAPASPFGTGVGPDVPADEAGVYEDFPTDPFAPADPFAPVADPFAPAGGPAAGHPQGHPAGGPSGAVSPEDTSVDGFAPIREGAPAPGAISGPPAGAAAQHGLPQDGLPQHGAPQQNGRPQPGLFASAPAGTDPFAAQRPPAGTDPFGTAVQGGLFPGAPGRQGETPAPSPGHRPEGPGATAPGRPQPEPGARTPGGPAGPVAAPAPDPKKPEAPKPAAPKPATGKAAGKPKAGAGKKLVKLGVYAVGGLLFLGAAAYGTGLMLNQSDIPKGTVVLGTDIGGNNRDQAIHQLDETIGKAGRQPVKLKIGEQSVDLDPAVAGLSFDTTATVDNLTRHSYSPVDVITSLKGGEKAVPPEVKVDRAKLKAALDALGAGSGQTLQEGYVKFSDSGEPVVVPGRAGQAVDSAAAVDQIEQAYRDRAAGKAEQPVALSVTAAQPKVSPQALQAAADSLGKSVVSGNVHVLAGTKKWDFGKLTAAKALTLVPDASGKIVPKWDLDALNGQINGYFDKVKVKKNGQTAVITAQDVADGITSVLDKSGDKDRTFKFATV
ncbi:peptidoglycan binding domain-containing protein [Kitasatospora sp. NPDC087315]|uniref:peptidoglycan binding domain-containing protein n=1 Tax=Kitasatospora sp. NPDC087315 TaxID=3364069 RepID=UPI0037F77BC2